VNKETRQKQAFDKGREGMQTPKMISKPGSGYGRSILPKLPNTVTLAAYHARAEPATFCALVESKTAQRCLYHFPGFQVKDVLLYYTILKAYLFIKLLHTFASEYSHTTETHLNVTPHIVHLIPACA
jgi:hypothetical protein